MSDSGDAIVYHSILRELDMINRHNAPSLLCCIYKLGLLDDESAQHNEVLANFKTATKKIFEPYEMDLLADVRTKDDLSKRQVTVFLIKVYVHSHEDIIDRSLLPQGGSHMLTLVFTTYLLELLKLDCMNRQFGYLSHQNQILYILVMCTVYEHIADETIKPWLTLLLTKPNEILFIKTSVSDVLLESKIVPETLKQSLLLRVIKEKDYSKLRNLLEWVETSQLVDWATRNHLLLETLLYKDFDQDTILFVITGISESIVKFSPHDYYYRTLSILMTRLIEKPHLSIGMIQSVQFFFAE